MSDKNKNGFTLVELAIVMVVIGILIGGILKGSELIAQARITRVVQDVEGYRAAYGIFKDKYNAIPGDMLTVNAQNSIPGCDVGNSCTGGDGSGFIGSRISAGDPVSQAQNLVIPQVETTMFWKHLALADLISGINTSAAVAPAEFGTTHPSTSYQAGFTVLHAFTVSGVDVNANYLRIQSFLVGTHPLQQNTMPLSPQKAWRIDSKLDDGIPNFGFVIGDNFNGISDSGDGRGCEGQRYQEDNDNQACIQLYKLP